MEVHDKLAQVRAYVDSARSVPMSASAMVNRSELAGMLAELASLLPADLAEADKVLAERAALLEAARAEADGLAATARARQAELVEEHEIVAAARAEAERLVAEADAQAAETRHEAEDYADERLANIELVLERLLTAVRGGRDHLSHLAEAQAPTAGLKVSDLALATPTPRRPDGDTGNGTSTTADAASSPERSSPQRSSPERSSLEQEDATATP